MEYIEQIIIDILDKNQSDTHLIKTILEKKSYFQIHNAQNIEEISDQARLLCVFDPISHQLSYEDIIKIDISTIIAVPVDQQEQFYKHNLPDHIKIISYPLKKIELLSSIYDMLGNSMDHIEQTHNLHKTFYKLAPNLLLHKATVAPCDIYLKVSQKHLKVINKETSNFDAALNTYVDKGALAFYITQNDFIQYRNFILSAPRPEPSLSLEEKLLSVNAFFHTLVSEIGVSKSSIKIADKLSSDIINNFSKNKKLNLLDKLNLQNIESDFIYNHSYLTGLLASELVKKLGLDTNIMGKKLVSASLLHDLAISDPKLSMIEHFSPHSVKDLPIKSQNIIDTHHILMANLLKEYIEVDGDTIQIIKDSHIENIDPIGLYQLRPLSFAFNICHEFIIKYMEYNFSKSKTQEIVEHVLKKFECDKHNQILDGFKSCFS